MIKNESASTTTTDIDRTSASLPSPWFERLRSKEPLVNADILGRTIQPISNEEFQRALKATLKKDKDIRRGLYKTRIPEKYLRDDYQHQEQYKQKSQSQNRNPNDQQLVLFKGDRDLDQNQNQNHTQVDAGSDSERYFHYQQKIALTLKRLQKGANRDGDSGSRPTTLVTVKRHPELEKPAEITIDFEGRKSMSLKRKRVSEEMDNRPKLQIGMSSCLQIVDFVEQLKSKTAEAKYELAEELGLPLRVLNAIWRIKDTFL